MVTVSPSFRPLTSPALVTMTPSPPETFTVRVFVFPMLTVLPLTRREPAERIRVPL